MGPAKKAAREARAFVAELSAKHGHLPPVERAAAISDLRPGAFLALLAARFKHLPERLRAVAIDAGLDERVRQLHRAMQKAER